GWADAGEQVTVRLGDQQHQSTAGDDGRRRVDLPGMDAGGPHRLEIEGKSQSGFEDVLIGEVLLGSGQSRLEWPVRQSMNAEEEIAQANHPTIRHFKVAHKVAQVPQDDIQGSWQVCSPETVANSSAVAYFFGRELNSKLDVPIGLVNSSWGGT